MPLKPLPVPDLGDTLQRLLATARPMLDDAAYEDTSRAVAAFEQHEGPGLQRALREFAEHEARAGRSWLSREWLEGYLAARTPLPLTSSVAFQLTGDFGPPGADRAAGLLHRAASIHLQQVRGETPQEMDPRGHEVDMRQWDCLRGGVRHPRAGTDEIRRPPVAAAAAEMGVLYRGRLYAAPISDAAGQPLTPQDFVRTLHHVLAAGRDAPEPPLPFGALSYLGSDVAAGALDELTAVGENATVYERVTRMVFMVHVLDEAAETAHHLERAAFEVGHAWAYKPLTYEVCLADEWLALHVEHSSVDGATILAIVSRLQRVEPPRRATGGHRRGEGITPPEPVTWQLPEDLTRRLCSRVAQYRRAAARYGVHPVFVPRPRPEKLGIKMSNDAVQQRILLYARVATYGRARSVYEAVDVREYRAGRTECLRPVTEQAVGFVTALHEGRATAEQFRTALDAHRDRVKACKAGRGVDRHLLGLELMARRAGRVPAFFRVPALGAIRRDFLSTTSIGGPDPIVRFAFAPTTEEGFGVSYTTRADGYEFCVIHHRDTSEDLEGFARHITEGAARLWEFAVREFATHPE